MKLTTILKSLLVLTAVTLLAACGGGSSGGDSAFQPAMWKISATPSSNSVQSGNYIDVAVRVTQANGSNVPDGTSVNASVSPASSGTLRHLENGALGGSSGGTVGGTVNFRFTATGPGGNANLSFSTTDTSAGGRSLSTSIAINVTAPSGTGPDGRLQLQATRTQLPVNHYAVGPFLGSPYMAEVTVTVKDGNGQLVNAEDGIQVSINPVGNTGGFTTLDDPATDDINEFLVRMGQAPVDVVAGKATLFVHSLDYTGSATLTVTTQDPVTEQIVTASMDFKIVDATPTTPSALFMAPLTGAIYAQGSGGNDSGVLHVEVLDAINQPVPDPVAGASAYNNYRLEIVDANAGEAPRLSGIDAAGNTVSGSQIDLRTTAGIGAANFIAGSGVGSFRVRMTADRADNNVDNGISDPVVIERSVIVSDGQLWDVEITYPTERTLFVNPRTGELSPDGEVVIPPEMDGTYSLTVGVVATDRLGNPVLPGTVINFGLVDEPQTPFGSGDFFMAGGDGDPQEGGTLFTAQSGCFADTGSCTTPISGGGAGAGDTLLIMAEHVLGNRDLEAARTITQVNNRRSLSVNYRFNHNDTTGQSVDYGGILPYIVGRAADGNVQATAYTNSLGVATTKMTYPQSKLGKVVALWAQGDGPVVAGQPKKVADVEFAYFAGLMDITLSASPSVIPANTTTPVRLCVQDKLRAPMGNVRVSFAFNGMTGQGWVDDIPSVGRTASPTLLGTGCTTAMVRTQGMLEENSEDASILFAVDGSEAEVTFSFQPLVLFANPTIMRSGGKVTLTLVNSSGEPQPGNQIVGTCTGANGALIGLDPSPGVTNANGQTTATIRAIDLDQLGQAGSGECVFETVDGSATATVTLQGQDLCELYTSPLPAGCPADEPEMFTLTVTVNASSASDVGTYSISSSPAGLLCSTSNGSPASTCSPAQFVEGSTVTLSHTEPAPGASHFVGWTGDCAPVNTSDPTGPAKVTMSSNNRTCTAVWSD